MYHACRSFIDPCKTGIEGAKYTSYVCFTQMKLWQVYDAREMSRIREKPKLLPQIVILNLRAKNNWKMDAFKDDLGDGIRNVIILSVITSS
jgi:outer membrane phospholipase A